MGRPTDDAYRWARDGDPQPLPALPDPPEPAPAPPDHGLDRLVRTALRATGLPALLESVTGRSAEVRTAAEEWHRQAVTLAETAGALRTGALTVAAQWEGMASDAFGGHLGEVVAAIDATAEDAARTAGILAQAARECRQAEEVAVGLVREAVEWLIAELAAMALVDVASAGLAVLLEPVLSAAQVAGWVARVERVSVQLGLTLRRLERAARELRQAERVADRLRKGCEARRVAAEIRRAARVGRLLRADVPKRDWLANRLVAKGVESAVAVPLRAVTGPDAEPAGPGWRSGVDLLARSHRHAADPADPADPVRARPYTVPRPESPFG
ncbi:WXG100 family type VII secretion target [Kitasatospora sp. NPDC052896]|uniref:WXG100 family type VII secretion target n=1 Tax=Kitasatospora sp. NPDC052896 TaxID=3364061 RepID=UPI0037C9701F